MLADTETMLSLIREIENNTTIPLANILYYYFAKIRSYKKDILPLKF